MVTPSAFYCSERMFYNLLSLFIELCICIYSFIVFVYYLLILASLYLPALSGAGAPMFYRTRFALRCAVSFYLIGGSVLSFLLIPFTICCKHCSRGTSISIIACIIHKFVCLISSIYLLCSAISFGISYQRCNAFLFALV